MPQPAEVQGAAGDLLAAYKRVDELLREAILDAKGSDMRALRKVLQRLTQMLRDLDAQTREWVSEQVPAVYQAGAVASGLVTGPVWTQTAIEAVQALAAQNYDELLGTVADVEGTTRRALRTLARAGALQVVAGGTPAGGVGRDLANIIQDAQSRVLTVTYSNGAVHSLADWADTALRTQTALAYNAGTLDMCRTSGVEWVELADGPACGLTSHDDTELANGMVVPIDTAQAYPIAHPRCARSIIPRVDITSQAGADGVNDSRDLEAMEAAAEVERERAKNGTVTGRRFKVATETARVARRQRAGRTVR